MPCCDTIEVSCCDTQISSDCPMEMTNCEISSFIPLMAAPLNEISGKTELDIQENFSHINYVGEKRNDIYTRSFHFKFLHPPDFYIPLLI